MLIAKCLKGKYEAKLEIPGREGYKPNNNPSLEYMYFLEPHIVVTQIIYYLNGRRQGKILTDKIF